MLIDILTLFYLLGNQCTSFNCVQAISLGFHTELIFRSGSGGEVHLGAPLFCDQYCLELQEHISHGSIVFCGLKTTNLDIKYTPY